MVYYEYISYGLPVYQLQLVCQLWFNSLYQLYIWFTSILAIVYQHISCSMSAMVYQYIGYGLSVYRLWFTSILAAVCQLWFTSILAMVYQHISCSMSAMVSVMVYQYIGCSMTAMKKQMFLMIFCSLKMSDTERLREEYNQLVEGTLPTCF